MGGTPRDSHKYERRGIITVGMGFQLARGASCWKYIAVGSYLDEVVSTLIMMCRY